MDLVHDRGSMHPVRRGGPWTPGPCFVLTLKVHSTCIKAYMVLKWAGVFQEFSTQVSYSVLQCIRSGGSFQSFLFF